MEDKEDTIYCEWCGELPYHISVYNEDNSPQETLLCKECFNQFLDESEDC